MKIALYNLEPDFVNAAMMQVSTYHKNCGDEVVKYGPIHHKEYDKIYCFSVFDFTPKNMVTSDMIKGGTGFVDLIQKKLPVEIEECDYDWSLYPNCDYSIIWFSRGCIRACPFCLSGNTLILMNDMSVKEIKDIEIGEKIIGVCIKTGEIDKKDRWYFCDSIVLNKTSRKDKAYKITLENEQTVICSAEHRWLTNYRGWKHTTGTMGMTELQRPYLTKTSEIKTIGELFHLEETEDFKKGYVVGMFKGDGTKSIIEDKREGFQSHPHIRLALCDIEALDRTERYMNDLGFINLHRGLFYKAKKETEHDSYKIESQRWDNYILLEELDESEENVEFKRGFVSGFYDAEGRYDEKNGVIRIANTNDELIDYLCECLTEFGFEYVLENEERENFKVIVRVRLIGGASKKFFMTFFPAISRKKNIIGKQMLGYSKVVSVEEIGEMELFDIQTTSENYIANGMISHNCLVNKKEGIIHPVQHKNLNPNGKHVKVMDNNFFANIKWREAVEQLHEWGQPVDFQGVDLRIMTEEMANALKNFQHYRQVHIAWDNPKDDLVPKLEIITKYIRPSMLMCYVLIGYWSTPEQDLMRVNKLREFKIDPYVMPFNKFDPYQRMFRDWVNCKWIYKSTTWEEYKKSHEPVEKKGQRKLGDLI